MRHIHLPYSSIYNSFKSALLLSISTTIMVNSNFYIYNSLIWNQTLESTTWSTWSWCIKWHTWRCVSIYVDHRPAWSGMFIIQWWWISMDWALDMAYPSPSGASVKSSTCIIHAATLSGLVRPTMKWILTSLPVWYIVTDHPQNPVHNPYGYLMQSQFLFFLIISCHSRLRWSCT
jgi:hypothetical protein